MRRRPRPGQGRRAKMVFYRRVDDMLWLFLVPWRRVDWDKVGQGYLTDVNSHLQALSIR